jgi:hypothetical protein
MFQHKLSFINIESYIQLATKLTINRIFVVSKQYLHVFCLFPKGVVMGFVGPKEAAEALGMTTYGLRRMVIKMDGKINEAVISTPGGQYRYDMDKLRDVFQQQFKKQKALKRAAL